MKTIRSAGAAAILLVGMSACQHIPPAPIDVDELATALESRAADVEPIRAYAEAIAAAHGQSEAEFNLDDGLSLREAQAIALWYNADARRARVAAKNAAEIAGVAGRWDDPQVSFSRGKKKEEGGDSQTLTIETQDQTVSLMDEAGDVERSWISAGSLSITIPVSGRMGALKRLRESEHGVALLAAAETEWQVAQRVEEAWIEWSATHERVQLLDDHLNDVAGLANAVEALASAGEIASTQARLFSVEKSMILARIQHAAAEEEMLRLRVIEEMGLNAQAVFALTPSIGNPADKAPNGTPPSVDASHPTLARVLREYETAERRLRLELKKQYPDITISPAYSDEKSESSFVVGLGIPVPVWNRNVEGIAQAVAARDAARLNAEAAYQRTTSELQQQSVMHEGAYAEWRQLSTDTAALIETQKAEALALLRAGELDMPLLFDAIRQIFEVKIRLLDALAEERTLAARIVAASHPEPFMPAAAKEDLK